MQVSVKNSTEAIPLYSNFKLKKIPMGKGELICPDSNYSLPQVQLDKLSAPFGVADGTIKGVPPPTIKYSINIQFKDTENKADIDFFNAVDAHCIKLLRGESRGLLRKDKFKEDESITFESCKHPSNIVDGSLKVDKNNVVYPKQVKLKLNFIKNKDEPEQSAPNTAFPRFKLFKGNTSDTIDVADFMKTGLEQRFEIVPIVTFEGIHVIGGSSLYPTWRLYAARIFLSDRIAANVTVDIFLPVTGVETLVDTEEVEVDAESEIIDNKVQEEGEEVEEEGEEAEEEDDSPPEIIKVPTPPPPVAAKSATKPKKAAVKA